jgi:hypothetical protein
MASLDSNSGPLVLFTVKNAKTCLYMFAIEKFIIEKKGSIIHF